jgi:hypothetical protein
VPSGANAPPRPTLGSTLRQVLRLTRARPRPPTTPRIPQTATSPDCSARREMAWLAPREDFYINQTGTLISMSAAGNLDVITCQDDDVPRKQPLAHNLTLFTTTTAWATSPSGAWAYGQPLSLGSLREVSRHESTTWFAITSDARASLFRIQDSASLRTLPLVYK